MIPALVNKEIPSFHNKKSHTIPRRWKEAPNLAFIKTRAIHREDTIGVNIYYTRREEEQDIPPLREAVTSSDSVNQEAMTHYIRYAYSSYTIILYLVTQCPSLPTTFHFLTSSVIHIYVKNLFFFISNLLFLFVYFNNYSFDSYLLCLYFLLFFTLFYFQKSQKSTQFTIYYFRYPRQ